MLAFVKRTGNCRRRRRPATEEHLICPFLAAKGSQPISGQVAAQPHHNYCSIKKINYLWRPVLPIVNARMAELVDALVSNTSSCKAVPVRSRLRVPFKTKLTCKSIVYRFFIWAMHQICTSWQTRYHRSTE